MKAKIDVKEDYLAARDSDRDDAYSNELHNRKLFQMAVDEGKQAAKNGDFSTEEEVRRVFAKYGVEY